MNQRPVCIQIFLPALARLIIAASEHSQIIVVSHAQSLIQALQENSGCRRLQLAKSFGETTLEGRTIFDKPKWEWPPR